MATAAEGLGTSAGGDGDGVTLRLVWPQWQGAGTSSVRSLAAEFPFDVARRGYTVGSAVLEAVLPPHDGPTAAVPVETGDVGLERLDGIEAIVWIDSHPDIGTPASEYPGYHAVAVTALTGHGDPDVLSQLQAIVAPERVALVGLHSWTEDDYPNIAQWGIRSFSPDDLRPSSEPLLGWLAATGCTRVAIHFDVDTIDSNEIMLGLGAEPGGLTSAQVRRIVTDVRAAADVVGFTVAEYFPRQVMHMQQILAGLPLIGPPTK
jgi:arginase